MSALLSVSNLTVNFDTFDGVVTAVRNVSFGIGRGESVALVGETGSGKSVTALSILGLLPPTSRIERGTVSLGDRDLLTMSEKEWRNIRGKKISMVFQEPGSSLNPVITIGEQIAAVIRHHQGITKREALAQAVELLNRVGVSAPERRVRQYPHELSGGMQQRVMIAMAISCEPELLIADEPTTALDVTIGAQILKLLDNLVVSDSQTSLLLITHDLGVVAQMCDRVMVMYKGELVEQSSTIEFFGGPKHPYSRALLYCLPYGKSRDQPLYTIQDAMATGNS
jgi:ABC-type dipeptide/oligopeptide/nickel transport system ATPase component